MKDNLKIGIEGNITITKIVKKVKEIIFDDHNTLGPDAAEIIVRSLSQVDFAKAVDGIKVSGVFGSLTSTITSIVYNATENSMTFRALFYEFDFSGTVTDMELVSTTLSNKIMASKTALSISKDGGSRLQIDWKLTVTLC